MSTVTVCMWRSVALVALVASMATTSLPAQSSDQSAPHARSGRKAFFLSVLVPGLGHRYVHGGRWNRTATVLGATDAVLWLGMLSARWQEGHFEDSYRALAGANADAQIDGKDRPFFVNLGAYDSSEEYVEFLLRARAWDRLADAGAPENSWQWDSGNHRMRYRDLRQDADRMSRRRTWIISSLVANRFFGALTALRSARRVSSKAAVTEIRIEEPWTGKGLAARVRIRF